MLNKQVDYKLFFSVFALIIFGMIMISSVSVFSSFKVTSILYNSGKISETYNHFYVIRNITHVFISSVILFFLVKVPYTIFERNAKKIFILTLLLMCYVLFFGMELNGAKGWISVKFLPFTLQPVEFLKFSLIIFLAYFFKKYQNKLSDFKKGFIPFLGIIGVVVVLLGLQPDFGSILLLVPISFLMFFVAGANFKHILTCILLGLILAVGTYNIGKYDKEVPESRNKLSYITDRIDNFITDEKELIKNKTINYQTEQGLIAIGSGGFTGLGFGNSIQKFGYLPEVQGDFIFSVIIEELGFLGGLFLLGFYSFIGYRGYFISYYSKDLFAKYASFGITSWLLFQAFINIGVNLNIVPLTGVTLPFISYGGSSLLALILGLGLLLNISRYIDETNLGNTKKHSRNITKKKVFMYNL